MRRVLAAAFVVLATLVAAPPAAAPAERQALRVHRTDVTWFDHSRSTAANAVTGEGTRPFRKVKVMFLVPEGPGPHPLVVWVHGVTGTGPAYEPVLRRWAEAGYAIAAPTMPLTSGAGAWSNLSDYRQQPGDVRFVIDRATRGYPRVFDVERIAVGGHSLGAITTIGTAYSSCCTDPRIDAAIEVAGVELPFPGGAFPIRPMPPVPLLAVHGAADRTVPVRGSDDLYAKATGPAHYLRFPQGGHSDVLTEALFQQAVVAFLDRYLGGDGTAIGGMPAAVAGSGGRATWQQRGR